MFVTDKCWGEKARRPGYEARNKQQMWIENALLATRGVVVMAQVRICQITKSHPCTCIDGQVHWLLFDYHNGMLYTPAWAGVKTITVVEPSNLLLLLKYIATYSVPIWLLGWIMDCYLNSIAKAMYIISVANLKATPFFLGYFWYCFTHVDGNYEQYQQLDC